MEEKTKQLLKKAREIMGDDADIFIIVHKDTQCGTIMRGRPENIAHAAFSCIHLPDNPIGQNIYDIIKLNVINIINNPSPYTSDLINTITNILHDKE